MLNQRQMQQTRSIAAQARVPLQLDALPHVDLPHPRRRQALLQTHSNNVDTVKACRQTPHRNRVIHADVCAGIKQPRMWSASTALAALDADARCLAAAESLFPSMDAAITEELYEHHAGLRWIRCWHEQMPRCHLQRCICRFPPQGRHSVVNQVLDVPRRVLQEPLCNLGEAGRRRRCHTAVATAGIRRQSCQTCAANRIPPLAATAAAAMVTRGRPPCLQHQLQPPPLAAVDPHMQWPCCVDGTQALASRWIRAASHQARPAAMRMRWRSCKSHSLRAQVCLKSGACMHVSGLVTTKFGCIAAELCHPTSCKH